MNFGRNALIFATSIGFALTTSVADARPEKPSLQLKLDDYSLSTMDYCFSSGLRIMLQQDHSQPIVSITEVIDKGSDADPVGLEGMAHLIEHLWFRSIEEGQPKVWDMLDELGAVLNAFTSVDVTTYMTVVPSTALEEVLKLEGRRLMGAKSVVGVVADDILVEREVVRNELRMRMENSGGAGLPYVYSKLWPEGHPYKRMTIGTHESLNNVKLQDVIDFTEKNYRPEHATLMIVGDFTTEQIGPLLQTAFPMELLKKEGLPDDAPLVDQSYCQSRVDSELEVDLEEWLEAYPPQDRTISYHKAGVEKKTAIMAWSLPGGYRQDQPLMEITASMLTSAVATYLNPDFNPATDSIDELSNVGCWLNAEEQGSAATCFIEMSNSADAEDVIEKAADGLYQMWNMNNRPYLRAIFGNAKNQQMAQVFRTVDEISSLFSQRATATAMFTHFTGKGQYFANVFNSLYHVDEGKAVELARNFLHRDRFVAVVLEPYGEDDIVTDSSDAEYHGKTFQGTVNTMVELESVDEKYLSDLLVLPDTSAVIEYTLDNGLRVVQMPYGTAPLLSVSMAFDGGELNEPTLGLADFTNRFTNFYPAGDGNSPLRLAGTWSGGSGMENQSLGITGSSKNMDGLLYLLRSRLEELEPELRDKRDYFDGLNGNIRTNRRYPEYWAEELTTQRLFPGHPIAGVATEERVKAMKSFGMRDIDSWLGALYRPDNAVLFLVGRMDPAAARALVESHFSDWSVKTPKISLKEAPAIPEAQAGTIIVLDKDRVSQTDVGLSCQVLPQTMENVQTHSVLGSLLSELSWIALREQSGVTYGAGSGVRAMPGGASMLIFSSLVQNDAAGLAAETFLGLPKKVKAGEYDQSLIPLMKLSTARKYVIGQQSNAQMLGRISYPMQKGWGTEYFTGMAGRLAGVTADDLSNEVDRCIGHEVVTIVGPSEIITPQLDERGLTYEVFDYEAERDRLWELHSPKSWKKEVKARAKSEKKKAKAAAEKAAEEAAE